MYIYICSKTFFLSATRMMIVSPYRISPSFTVSESHCIWYGTSSISSGHAVMIMSARALSSGSSWIASRWSHFFSESMYTWLTDMSRRISGVSSGEYLDKVSATTISSPG